MRALSKTPALDLPELAGLDQPSLFDTQPVPTGEPLMVPIDRLDQDPSNPRTEFPQQAIDELAQDIAQRGILQPIVVSAADKGGRYRIRFGSQRWRAARIAGLTTVPVTVRPQPCDAYDQVAENLKRQALSALELARFIRSRVEAGESNAFIAKRLVMDQTTVAHHLTLLELTPELSAVLDSGRCTSPRTLHELQKLQAGQPEAVAELLAGGLPVTRDAVAGLRDAARPAPGSAQAGSRRDTVDDRLAQLFGRSQALCDRLDRALARLLGAGAYHLPAEQLGALRQRLAALAQRLGG